MIPPVTPPPLVTNRDTGSLGCMSALAGVQLAKNSQFSAEAQATATALRGSPKLTMGLGGPSSFQRLDDLETGGKTCDFRVLERERRTRTEVCRVNPLVGLFGIYRRHPAEVTNRGVQTCK